MDTQKSFLPGTGPEPLPPLGPAWAGALMGASVTASLTGIHVGTTAGGVVTAVSGVVFVAVLTGWVVESLRLRDSGIPRRLAAGFVVDALPAWSMVTMGVLSLGSAVDTNFGWTTAHLATWIVGTVAAVVVAVSQLVRLVRGKVEPVFPGVLPLVAPMVAATNAAQSGYPGTGLVLFAGSLATAVPAFVRVYLGDRRRPGPATAATTWIPLGVVGQSSAAALLIGDGLAASAPVGQVYATVMLTMGVPAALWAVRVHWGSLLHRPWPPYGPAWWACTFPVGTCSLGTHLLSTGTGVGWLETVSAGALVLLCVHVLLAATGAVVHVVRTRRTSYHRKY